MTGLAVVCLDKGMHVQFERFKERREILFKFNVQVNDQYTPNDNALSDIVVSQPKIVNEKKFVNIESWGYLTLNRLNQHLKNSACTDHVNLFSLNFPDPMNPRNLEIAIEIPLI